MRIIRTEEYSLYMPHGGLSNDLDNDLIAEREAMRYELDNCDNADAEALGVMGYQDIDPTMPVDMIIR